MDGVYESLKLKVSFLTLRNVKTGDLKFERMNREFNNDTNLMFNQSYRH